MKKPVLCLLGLHKWLTHHNDEGQPYLLCVSCKKYRETLNLAEHPLG
jgi:hypothetical protein